MDGSGGRVNETGNLRRICLTASIAISTIETELPLDPGEERPDHGGFRGSAF
jgi:hypothetical protein